MTDKEEIIEKIRRCKDVLPPKIINGYFVRTIVSTIFYRQEVKLNILAVFRNKDDKEVLQYNVDVENLFGTLFTTTCINSTDIEGVAEQYLNDIKTITKERNYDQ